MEKLKTYWREIIIVLLVTLILGNFFKQRKAEIEAPQIVTDSLRFKQALEATKILQDYLAQEKQALQEKAKQIEKLEELNGLKVEKQKVEVAKAKKKYEQVKSNYSSTTLDSLILIYSKYR